MSSDRARRPLSAQPDHIVLRFPKPYALVCIRPLSPALDANESKERPHAARPTSTSFADAFDLFIDLRIL
jgi:hypothetical protein